MSGDGTPIEDNQYTLTCTVSGQQLLMATAILYQWSNTTDFLQSQTATLNFNPVDRYDSGTYTCQVTIRSPLLNGDITVQNLTTFQVTGK